jgi:hypothetical protein
MNKFIAAIIAGMFAFSSPVIAQEAAPACAGGTISDVYKLADTWSVQAKKIDDGVLKALEAQFISVAGVSLEKETTVGYVMDIPGQDLVLFIEATDKCVITAYPIPKDMFHTMLERTVSERN